MNNNYITFSVVSHGKIKESHDLEQVQQSLANLFKIKPEQAGVFLTQQKTIKKNLNLETAQSYKKKIETTGLLVAIKEHRPKTSTVSQVSLELLPTEEEIKQKEVDEIEKVSAVQIDICCPKCNTKQPKSEECINCGVFFHKLSDISQPVQQIETEETQASESFENQADQQKEVLSIKAILAGVAVAFVGALIWKYVAIASGYEYGFIAWIIGGAVGFTVASLGEKGQITGIICGVLTIVAILAGKYMTIESFKNEMSDEIFSSQEFRQQFEEANALGKMYLNQVSDEDSLRQFMLDYEYTEMNTVDEITSQEIEDFRVYSDPGLRLAADSSDFESWIKNTLEQDSEDYSTVSLMTEDFGLMSFVFLILGVGTAFRLGNGD